MDICGVFMFLLCGLLMIFSAYSAQKSGQVNSSVGRYGNRHHVRHNQDDSPIAFSMTIFFRYLIGFIFIALFFFALLS